MSLDQSQLASTAAIRSERDFEHQHCTSNNPNLIGCVWVAKAVVPELFSDMLEIHSQQFESLFWLTVFCVTEIIDRIL